jgi:hypothetical protein
MQQNILRNIQLNPTLNIIDKVPEFIKKDQNVQRFSSLRDNNYSLVPTK